MKTSELTERTESLIPRWMADKDNGRVLSAMLPTCSKVLMGIGFLLPDPRGESEKVTVSYIARETGLTRKTVANALRFLETEKVIQINRTPDGMIIKWDTTNFV